MTQSSKSGGGVGSTGLGSAAGITDHPAVRAGARAGHAVNGVLQLLIAWLGVQVALGSRGADADPAGAMALVAGSPVGFVLLVAIVVALALLAVWQVGEAIRGRDLGDRVKAAGKALVYLALAWSGVSFLMGSRTSGDAQAEDATATLMDLPFGTALVVLAGLGIAGIGGYHIYKGWTEKFREDLTGFPPRFTVMAGKIGYIARGVALIAVGVGFATAGLTHDPSKSQGLDGALDAMVRLPLGQALVLLVAVGFAAFGLYCFSRARRART